MDAIQSMILLSFGIAIGFAVLLGMVWLFVLHYILRPHYLKALIYGKDGRRGAIWLKKVMEKDQKGTAFNKKYGTFSYNVNDVFDFGAFKAIDISTQSFKALKLNLSTMQLDAQRSMHPSLLHDLFIDKFISELLKPKMTLTDILVIVIIVMQAVGIFLIFQAGNDIGDLQSSINGMQNNMTIMQDMIRMR